jgi:hypothetical protein
MISQKTWAALAIGLLATVGAHASGKPWWVDQPPFGDAFDVGFFAFIALRLLLGAFDRDARP